MPLQRVADYIGNKTFVNDDPMCEVYRDVLYVPDGDPKTPHGIFDHGRKCIQAAGYYRAMPHPTLLQDSYTTLDAAHYGFAPDDVHYVLLGSLTAHYGHFIMSSMARLWASRLMHDPLNRFVIFNHGPVETFFDSGFIADCLGALGLGPDSVVNFAGPTRLRRVTIPSPAIEEHNFSHRTFGALCSRIGDVLVTEINPPSDQPVFLSKSRLTGGVSKLVNEDEFCHRLDREGVEIVYPEMLSFDAQISLFRSRRLITGLAGSGMHTSVFAPRGDKLTMSLTPKLLSNQYLLDNASGGTSVDVYPDDIVAEHGRNGFQNIYHLADPQATAQDFLRIIDAELRPVAARRHRRGVKGRPPSPRTRRLLGETIFCLQTADMLRDQEGWCEMEGGHCWTQGPRSTLRLALPPCRNEVTLSLRLGTMLRPPHLVSRPCGVTANDVEITQFAINRETTYACVLRRGLLDEGLLRLRFDHPLCMSPQDLGAGDDPRRLSVMFMAITLHETVHD